MAGMLTVVNPRRRRRKSSKRRTHRAKKATTRRRRRTVRAIANPRRRRRRVSRRRTVARRRRHSNPRGLFGGGLVSTLTSGLALGAGAIGTNLATNGINNLLGANKLTGPMKIALKAVVGLVALPMLLKFVPGGAKFSSKVRIGAGVAIAYDVFDTYVKPMVPAYLADYEWGSLNGWAPQPGLSSYEQGTLNGWAPQDGMGDVYSGSVYGG